MNGEPGGSEIYTRPPNIPYQPPVNNNPPGTDGTLLIIVGSLVAIVGNYLLKPLFSALVKGLEADQASPQRIETILNGQIERLQGQNDRFIDVMESHTEQSMEIAQTIKLLETTLLQLTERLERIEQAMITNKPIKRG